MPSKALWPTPELRVGIVQLPHGEKIDLDIPLPSDQPSFSKLLSEAARLVTGPFRGLFYLFFFFFFFPCKEGHYDKNNRLSPPSPQTKPIAAWLRRARLPRVGKGLMGKTERQDP
jgi:hypothetical protein